MPVNAEWVRRNLAFDGAASDVDGVADREADSDRALRRKLIDYDSQGSTGAAFQKQAAQATVGLSHFVPIPWPAHLAPRPGSRPVGESLPTADVLIVTWTMDEGHALSRVLTPGFDSEADWKPYTKNFDEISKTMVPDCPARQLGRLGTYWTTEINSHPVTLFKSDSHMSQDGPKLANAVVWRQIIQDCAPKWVITTGTGGGIGPQFEVGDVVVSRFVTFDCTKEFAKLNGETFSCPTSAPSGEFTTAQSLFGANDHLLPEGNTRPPRIVSAVSHETGILTTDFFGFDNTADTDGLQGNGDLCEMGDAVLGMVCKELGDSAPEYVIVRNVSDPQIDSTGLSIEQQTELASRIYQGYGLWSTVCSAIVCWAIVAA
jgi:nucleoside phosphorylase